MIVLGNLIIWSSVSAHDTSKRLRAEDPKQFIARLNSQACQAKGGTYEECRFEFGKLPSAVVGGVQQVAGGVVNIADGAANDVAGTIVHIAADFANCTIFLATAPFLILSNIFADSLALPCKALGLFCPPPPPRPPKPPHHYTPAPYTPAPYVPTHAPSVYTTTAALAQKEAGDADTPWYKDLTTMLLLGAALLACLVCCCIAGCVGVGRRGRGENARQGAGRPGTRRPLE